MKSLSFLSLFIAFVTGVAAEELKIGIIDLQNAETGYRILSFMALGVVLLVLGFIYNKYQEKLKEWL